MHLVRRVLVVLVVALVVGGAALNGFLYSQWATRVMNLAPNVVQIHYTKAYSPWPFHMVIDNFQLSVQDPNIQLFVSADHVSADIYPWTLLRHRFFGTNVVGNGVVFRLRSRVKPGDGTIVANLPPIPGFEHPESDGSTFPALDKMITVELRKLDVQNLREVWINDIHVEGTFDLDGGFFYKPFQLIEISTTHFTRGEGQVMLANKPLATIDKLRLTAELEETVLGEEAKAGAGFLDHLSASVVLEAQLVDARALNVYLRGVPQVRVDEGAGKLSLALSAKGGVLDDGGVFSLDTDKVVIHLPYFEVVGRAAIRYLVKAKEGWLTLHVPEFSLLQRSDGKAVLKGAHFRLTAAGSSKLNALTENRIELALEGAHANDLSFLDSFIPAGTGVRIAGGAGTVSGKVSIAGNHRGHGVLDIEGDKLRVQNRSAALTGKAKIHGQITNLDLDSGDMNISGSTIALTDVSVQSGTSTSTGFWLKLLADPCLYTPKKPLNWATNLKLEFQNLAPVVAIIAANLSLPDVLKAFADEPGVKASANLAVHKDFIELEQLRLDSPRIHAQGEVKLMNEKGSTAKVPNMEPWGAALVKVRNLSVGLELLGPAIKAQLFEPDRWYASWQEQHPGKNQAPSAKSD